MSQLPVPNNIDGSGYVSAYVIASKFESARDVMQCFTRNTLPVLTQLAEEFVVCDSWFSAMAGPTEPNRMFVHAATCGEFDDSPSEWEQFVAETLDGIEFDHGTLFDRLEKAELPYRIYAGDRFPNVAELDGVSLYRDIHDYDDFDDDINDDDGYKAVYTFIEPNYDAVEISNKFYEGNSQHPPGSVAAGERLIKDVYEKLRASPLWDSSMLVVVWDEHGGFYDHVLPPRAEPTGKEGRDHGFLFDQYGPRVPAVVISPLIPRNMIEHRQLEHSVIPATIEQMFQLDPLTKRDAGIVGLHTLATLDKPRTDAPMKLKNALPSSAERRITTKTIDPNSRLADIQSEELVALLRRAVKANIEFAPDQADSIKARVAGFTTVGEASNYIEEMSTLIGVKRKERRQELKSVKKPVPDLVD